MKIRSTVDVAATVMVVVGLLLPMTPASAQVDASARDATGDAHRALDVTRLDVSHTDQALRVIVQVRDYASMGTSGVGTAVGVHFDTVGDGKPDHLIRIEGMHTAAGSTDGWNELRPNGLDPWGDWIDCFPNDWEYPLIKTRARTNRVIFMAPLSCLDDPESVRVAVQSYKPYRTRVQSDRVTGVRRYALRLNLSN